MPPSQSNPLIGESEFSLTLRDRINQVAPTPLSVQITGETGTGKEVVARMLHQQSGRGGDFVVVDCAALSPTLVESELFGHVRGAFTGATRHREGLVAAARGGTLFLDEIGDLPLEIQTRLLRLLQENSYRPVGAEEVRHADIRVISASWRDLNAAVSDGIFREDLFHRLAGYTFHLEPLRRRHKDLHCLAEHFLETAARQSNTVARKITPSTWHHLQQWPWPGNVRELRNAMQYAQAMAAGARIRPEDLPQRMRGSLPALPGSPKRPVVQVARTDLPYMEARRQCLDDFQIRYVSAILDEFDGNISAAARASGMDRKSIQRILARLELSPQPTANSPE
jgi:DNA-binding NtrC family response regulator